MKLHNAQRVNVKRRKIMETTVKLVGKVMKSGKDGLVLRTVGIGKDGKEYPDDFFVMHGLPEPPKAGEKIEIVATTEYDAEDGTVWLEAKSVRPVVSTVDDTNLAIAEGTAHGVFQFFGRDSDKMSFGNGLLKVGEKKWQRGVAFGYLAHKLSKEFRSGAVVRMAGRLRKQSYEKNGADREVFEIILDAEHTKVLKKAPESNPYDFAGITDKPEKESRRLVLADLIA